MADIIAPQESARPPVIVVMGHIDHGKTSLLDYIRKSNTAAKEAGAITQRLGAYQVRLPKQDKLVTFIDTPGHEAFAKMRSRGSKIADLAVLVVAADDGVMPQTKESIKYINEARIPFLVAINKTDLPQAPIDKVKGQLAEAEVIVEDYGGKVVAVPISAKTGKGVDELLEMILLLAEMQELKVDQEKNFTGVVIESRLDPRRGPIAVILVKTGRLLVGDQVSVGKKIQKVKAIFNDLGNPVSEALPGQPVEVLGLAEIPEVGTVVGRSNLGPEKEESAQPTMKQAPPESETKKVKIILKTDVSGSLEAIRTNLPEEVLLVLAKPGQICDSDILLAKATGAQILGFNLKIPTEVAKLAKIEGVRVKTFAIIYDLLKELENQVLKLLEPTIDEEVLGKAEIIAEFEIGGQRVAGARVLEGNINKKEKIHLVRNAQLVGEGMISSLKYQKENIQEAAQGTDFGATFRPNLDFKLKDVIISFREKQNE
ncbi:translation initiation factor IF-2 [Candidatus Shapirobacteria bacterium]|nr:translation initiation factor IF-2 [Candidatus Shapirobacteria bacterium]